MRRKSILVSVTAIVVVLGLCGSAWAEWSEPVPVLEVNTAYSDAWPFLSFDGLTLYFTRMDTDTFYYTRIFQATRPVPSGPFTSVQNISTLNYSGGHVSFPWVSQDNLRMYYYRTEPGSIWRMKLSERASVSDPWPAGVNISELNAVGNIYAPSLTADELTVFFATYGEYDIWTANRPDRYSAFGNIRNLTEINTTYGDSSPHISADGLTLHFSSSRNGTSQIFKATRGSLSEPFGNVEHLSFFDTPGGNSVSPCPSYDGTAFYFGSALTGETGDIYVSYLDTGTGPVAHWKFDEGAGSIAYDSAGTNDGIIYGAGWTTGVIETALSFDGLDDYVDVGDGFADFTNGLSIALWAYPDYDSTHERFIEFGNGEYNDNILFSRHHSTYSLVFQAYSGSEPGDWVLTEDVIELRTWQHFVVTVNSAGDTVIYKNGIDISNGKTFVPRNVLRTENYIGRSNWVTESTYKGQLDEIEIFNRALSAGEIEEIYNSVAPIGVTYHVDVVNGDDLNDGLSRETAFATIQMGIDTAQDYDTVLVWPGVYQENIILLDIGITVQSADDAVVIDGDGGVGVAFYTGDGPDSMLKNFVIKNCYMGVYCLGGSPMISNVTIVDNDYGVGAYAGAQPNINNCILWDNMYGDLDGEEWQVNYSYIQDEVEPDVPLEGLVSHWTFDEGEGSIAYDSASTNDGTIYGATWTTGKIDGALDFDGDDYVEVSDDPSLRFTQYDSFSISSWVKPVESISGGYIVCKMRASHQSGYFGYRTIVTTDPQFVFSIEKSMYDSVPIYTGDALFGEWSHVTAVYDNKDMKIYLDGELEGMGTFNLNTGSTAPDKDFTIGARSVDSLIDTYFNGAIDDVRIYNKALSAEEIQQLYQPLGLVEPKFVDAENGDYHLLSERGRYWPEHDVWVLDDVTSPCIDGGDPTMSPWDEPMPNGGRINMGAYGGTAYASMSEWPLKHDSNYDGIVNMLDLAELAQEWLQGDAAPSPPPPPPPPPLPSQASNPNPANGAAGVDTNADLSWTPGTDAYGHDVYFGTSSPGTFRGYQAAATFDPGTMAFDTTYYWRIDEVNASGTTTGTVWSFTTEDSPIEPPDGPP